MREVSLFQLSTPYRETITIKGWQFGNPEQKTLAVVGALRGNEIQQMRICAKLIQALRAREAELSPECGILVMPCANQFSMNVGRRFWAADNTDINRMFPGYDEGETTQRIADHIFKQFQGYEFGVHLTSLYLPGHCMSHVRIMETGYQNPEVGKDFGLPYVMVRKPHPYDTTTLNYNWQIWNTQAFSLYTRETDQIDEEAAEEAATAILRFLAAKGYLQGEVAPGAETVRLCQEQHLQNVLTEKGGLLVCRHVSGDVVQAGEVLGLVEDPCTGDELEVLTAPCAGKVFFSRRPRLVTGHEVTFRIICDETGE